jgi:hypothetical protein
MSLIVGAHPGHELTLSVMSTTHQEDFIAMGASAILPELFNIKKSSEASDDDAGIARCSISSYKPGSIINKGVNAFKMGCILEGYAVLKTGHVVADRLEPGDMYGGVTMIEQARQEHYPSSRLAEISNRHSRLLYG